ncbi:ISSod13 [Klebsiella quasipneumoniae]|nr:ISSod13 [Klebsiella quasipneumoniae]SLW21568.1 ISSod13 [Klebsiella quasipneumoniae]SMA17874.1 ISSod13 [Klebsiella quasipneumoniae]SMA29196.1 ISSod13 [Klebsiella quasipneumoniae]SMA30857.1 ISSod13 [Klebsiella quasipneumoniae]
MLHTTNPVIKHKAGLLNLAEELSNVSKACKIMGVSRDTFYRYRELADEGGVDALLNRSRRAPNLKNRTDEATERAVVDYAVEFPAHGQHRTSNELRKQGVFISGSGVRSVWLRHNLENFKKRLQALEEKSGLTPVDNVLNDFESVNFIQSENVRCMSRYQNPSMVNLRVTYPGAGLTT